MNVFSGFDGMSCGRIALDVAKIKVSNYYASEIDPYAQKVSNALYPDIIRLGNIENWKSWIIDWASIDLVIGGSPCQGFSFAGKQLAFDDPRSRLFFIYVDILNHIKTLNPNVKFLLENVKMKKQSLDVITSYMGIEPIFINSELVSAQNRQRYYWCNWYADQPKDLRVLLSDILENNVDDSYYHTPTAVDYMNRIGSTGRSKWSYLFHSEESKGKSQCLTANFFKGVPNNVLVCGRVVGRRLNPETGKRDDYNFKVKTEQRFEARYDKKTGALTTVQNDNVLGLSTGAYVHKNNKAYALTANCAASDKAMVINPVEVRKFTPRECARLQTIPEHYIDVMLSCGVSNTQIYKMLGNGWTVNIIVDLFKYMMIDRIL